MAYVSANKIYAATLSGSKFTVAAGDEIVPSASEPNGPIIQSLDPSRTDFAGTGSTKYVKII